MKKTISYKVAQPPFGINGNLALRNLENGQVFDNQVYIPYSEPFLEARCVYLGREGAVIALATPKDNGTGIEYRFCIASALISQSFALRGEFTKVMGSTPENAALGKYIDGMMDQYDPINGVKTLQSIYTKAAVKIDESLSKAMASDESELIDFSYEIEYFPSIIDKYVTLAGNWFKTRNGEFYNPFADNEKGLMENIYMAEDLGTQARAGGSENKFQKPDGSFISFWPIDTEDLTQSSYAYNQEGLQLLVEDGRTTLDAYRAQQVDSWVEEYTPA